MTHAMLEEGFGKTVIEGIRKKGKFLTAGKTIILTYSDLTFRACCKFSKTELYSKPKALELPCITIMVFLMKLHALFSPSRATQE